MKQKDQSEALLSEYNPPELHWAFSKNRQVTVEKKIKKLVDKKKPFYLTVTHTDETIEEWFIDVGNWVSPKQENGKYYGAIGHIHNFLPFIAGKVIAWDGLNRKSSKRIKRK